MAPFEELYRSRCRSPIGWYEVGKTQLFGPNLVHQAMEKVKIIRERLKTAQSRHKSYDDVRRRDLEFEVDDWVFLKVSPTKGVMQFRKKRKLSPHYIGPYQILRRIVLPVEEINVQDSLSYEEEPIAILDRQVPKLRSKEIVLIKVWLKNQKEEKATWESDDDMQTTYPNLFETVDNDIEEVSQIDVISDWGPHPSFRRLLILIEKGARAFMVLDARYDQGLGSRHDISVPQLCVIGFHIQQVKKRNLQLHAIMGRSCNLLFALAVFILLHHDTSLVLVPNICTDEAALLALKSHISYHRNNILARNWSSSTPICSWIGITCSTLHLRVTALDISRLELHGTIPPHLGNHSFLVSLRISNNSCYGELPVELGHLQRLKLISVTGNNFAIPSFLKQLPLRRDREIGDLHYLTILDLQINQLTGSIPTSIFNITTMQNIALTESNLTGKLPKTICDHLPNMEGLYLSINYLRGIIPPNLEKCRKLQILSLSLNEFIGTVPKEVSNLTALRGLYISALHLEGEISVELGNLNKLQRLALTRNEFTGSVPAGIFNISTLQFLAFSENKLSGTLPSDLGRGMLILEKLYCAANILTGFISSSISNSWKLRIVDLSVNSFTGPIPDSLGNLKYLEHLNLAGNTFFSETTVSSLTSLTNCRNLRVLSFGGNQLDSTFPTSVENFSNSLQTFKAPDCKLKGNIPKEIDLSGNQLSGSVPPCIGNITSLRTIYLDYNRLDSRLTASIGGLHNLIEFNISSNLLSETIPQEIGNLKAATLVDLSKNIFSGKIPSILGGLDKLFNLSLAHNRLNGPIQDSFGKLLALEFLVLCYKNLSGENPKTIEALVYLKYLNFSFNKLSRVISSGGPFANATARFCLSHNAPCGNSKYNVSANLPRGKRKS
ncbi:hypothetical protein CQW23_13924 [Capsicum baccatum]|uniref:Uncharacterized protein n=1 Tax=Capsicum baccatum TaxID=33114 RepID=A0A2G2WHP5_CAPBA|nr:hypothetical protein CQW23_13924 [Capsicum baccatum]